MNVAVLKLIETVFNRYLALDPEVAVELAGLQGKMLCFDITTPEMTVYCRPAEASVQLLDNSDVVPDCTIRATAMDLLAMIRSDDPAQAISSGTVEIRGDSRLAQDFSDILKRIDIDWDDLASNVIGDFAAHKIGGVGRVFQQWARNSSKAFGLDVSEYLREESGVLPTKIETESFMEKVDTFRSGVDRLEARIRRLENQQQADKS